MRGKKTSNPERGCLWYASFDGRPNLLYSARLLRTFATPIFPVLCDQHLTVKNTCTDVCDTQFAHSAVWPHEGVEVCEEVWYTVVLHKATTRSHDAGNWLQAHFKLQVKRMITIQLCDNIYMSGKSPGKITRQVSRSFTTSITNSNTQFKPMSSRSLASQFVFVANVHCSSVF